MTTIYPSPIFSEVIDFLVSSPTPDDIIAFRPSPDLQARLDDLLHKNQRDALSEAERAELDEFLRLNHFMTMLKIRARQKLAGMVSDGQ